MHNRIVLITRSGSTLYGDIFRSVSTSRILFPDYDRHLRKKHFDELEAAMTKHRLTLSDIDRWYVGSVD